jgi:hypothetical protein
MVIDNLNLTAFSEDKCYCLVEIVERLNRLPSENRFLAGAVVTFKKRWI